jgi:hypothetical protein
VQTPEAQSPIAPHGVACVHAGAQLAALHTPFTQLCEAQSEPPPHMLPFAQRGAHEAGAHVPFRTRSRSPCRTKRRSRSSESTRASRSGRQSRHPSYNRRWHRTRRPRSNSACSREPHTRRQSTPETRSRCRSCRRDHRDSRESRRPLYTSLPCTARMCNRPLPRKPFRRRRPASKTGSGSARRASPHRRYDGHPGTSLCPRPGLETMRCCCNPP